VDLLPGDTVIDGKKKFFFASDLVHLLGTLQGVQVPGSQFPVHSSRFTVKKKEQKKT
jgi:hypothetical protein